jgi:predicted aconitase with swiveling domain
MLREMASRKVCPAAFVFNRVNPILAQGASFGNLSMLDRFEDGDVTKLLKNGSRIRVEPAEGRLTVLQEP